jgi:PilZ domain
MPCTVRPFRRFPVCCPVTYHAALSEGRGTIWNVSLNGWRLVGQSFPMTVTLPNQRHIFVAAAVVRWMRSNEYGIETVVTDNLSQGHVARYIRQQSAGSRRSV